MNIFMLVSLSICLLTPVLSRPKKPLVFQEEWHLWKSEHKKSYRHHDEEVRRHGIWLANKRSIEEHNSKADSHGFTLHMNHLGDQVRSCGTKRVPFNT